MPEIMQAPSESDFILVVDDNPINLEVVGRILKNKGFSVRIAIDGESALQQAIEEQPTLILLDIMLSSGADGFETCRRLKESSATQSVPIIFMTALSESESKVHGLSLGAVDYVTKPFNEAELLARVNTHLRLQDLMRALQNRNQQLEQEIDRRQVTEESLQRLNRELRKAQVKLVQQEKLSAMKEVVQSIECEINEVARVGEYSEKLLAILKERRKTVDLGDIPRQLGDVSRSLKLTSNTIVAMNKSLRLLAQDKKQMRDASLHELLDNTLIILRYRLKSQGKRAAIEVDRQYGHLPRIRCFPDQILQALMNILSSTIDAFDEFSRPSNAGSDRQESIIPQIQISTSTDGIWCILDICDNEAILMEKQIRADDSGRGLKAEQDTGLNLLIAHQIIVDTHGGKFSFDNSGSGTKIEVKLPLQT